MKPWFFYSSIVLLILSVQDVLHRFLMKKGYHAFDLVVYGLVPTILFIGIYGLYTKQKLTPLTQISTILYIISGILSFYGFLYLRKAQILSPNMGYVNAIAYSSILVTIIITAWLFKDSLHWQGWLGSIFVVIGIGLISSI
jgi:uncharacterized membrane protein